MIFGVLNHEKICMERLQTCPPHLSDVATLPWEIQKKLFSTVLFIHTTDTAYRPIGCVGISHANDCLLRPIARNNVVVVLLLLLAFAVLDC